MPSILPPRLSLCGDGRSQAGGDKIGQSTDGLPRVLVVRHFRDFGQRHGYAKPPFQVRFHNRDEVDESERIKGALARNQRRVLRWWNWIAVSEVAVEFEEGIAKDPQDFISIVSHHVS